MANNNLAKLQKDLTAAYALIQNKQATKAVKELHVLLKKWPKNPDLIHLLALAYKSLNENELAIKSFLSSLALNKQQPQVHNNLAGLYKYQKQYKRAEKHYSLAISLQANYFEAIRNLAICYSSQKQYQNAINTFVKALLVKSDDVSALTGLADCYRLTGDSELAHENYSKAISLSPTYVNAWHNLGLNHHLMGKLGEAINCYKQAYQLAPENTDLMMSLASAMDEVGETNEAISLFKHALQNKPNEVAIHERYNEILWESEFTEQFGDSFRRAIQISPNNLDLRISFIAQLFRAAEISLARDELNEALKIFDDSHQLLSLKGQIQAEEQAYEDAYNSLSESLAIEFTKLAAQALVKLCLILERYEKTQELLNQLLEYDYDCQLTWALQSLAWRLSGDKRYQWLNDYERFVQAYELEAPEGYSTIDEFLMALEKVLLKLHRKENAPLQQTLRNGTQTAARLLHKPIPELILLKNCLTKIVKDYISHLPDDSEHPLLNRKSEFFEFYGSWSVKLRPEGFHVNHVHPAGWISSAVYISIPNTMQKDTESLEGSIKFGESPLSLGDREAIGRTIKPKPGSVVLFPSYMWHGTYPFTGSEGDFRMTSPIDVIPL